MNIAPGNNPAQLSPAHEVEQLREQVAALEQLLEVYEQETLNKSARLEQTLSQLQDHTQRLTHAESTLRALRSILDSMGDAVIVADQQGKFLFLNPAAASILGITIATYSFSDWAQSWTSLYGLFLPDQTTPYPLEEFPLHRAMQGELVDEIEVFVRTPEIEIGHWFSVTARTIRNDAGEIQGGVAVFHNITRLKHTEVALRHSETHSRQQAGQLEQTLQHLKQTQAQLVQTEKMSSLGQLVAGIAHEINNPISFIYGNITPASDYVQSLLELLSLYQHHYPVPVPAIQATLTTIEFDFLLTDLPRVLQSLKYGAERVRQIIHSLRNFSRLDEAEVKQVDIHEGLNNTLLILQNRLQLKQSCEIQVQRQYGDLPEVECYPSQMNQVFLNILANAIDTLAEKVQGLLVADPMAGPAFTPTITIRSTWEQSLVKIQISDNGMGIAPEIQSRIFDPFFTTKPVGQGVGLGLAISYQVVVQKHRGSLRCQSNPGQGTDFWIEIPATINP